MRCLAVILLLSGLAHADQKDADVAPCTVVSGNSHIIVSIVESQGDEVLQSTDPEELPIAGVPGESIGLSLLADEASDNDLFALEGKRLTLRRPLDRDDNDLGSIMFQVVCTTVSSGRRKTIPLVVTVSDINDNRPVFVGEPYQVTVPESTPVNSTIFAGLRAIDNDSNVNGQVDFRIIDDGGGDDEGGIFTIDLPHQGLVKLARQLDYETSRRHVVTIVASDRAVDKSSRFSTTTTLTVNVRDSDDLPPKFVHQTYTAKIISELEGGAIEVLPEKIRAEDQDSLRVGVTYSFSRGVPLFYEKHFQIDSKTGIVKQTSPVKKTATDQFNITVKATEVGENAHFSEATLIIDVMAEDINPPVLIVTSVTGYVDENSSTGTRVHDQAGNDLRFRVSDKDLISSDAKPNYEFELTTTSFSVDSDGYLVVNDANLDRDPPNEPKLSFQVFARETEGMKKASSPLAIVVHLRDINDNPPVLAAIRDVTLPAGNQRRVIAKLNATDNDSSKRLRYRLVHVSNNGAKKFAVDSRSGKVEVLAPVKAGEHFTLTFEATDDGGKSSQGIMEVRVSPGPNLRGPVFEQFLYDVTVSEGATKFTAVVTTKAKDPEGGTVRYTIVGGNEMEEFEIEESTGVIRVMHPLDRERVRRYSLIVRAEDSGGKFSTCSVNIVVTDINDENPRFVNVPYSFRVAEGQIGAPVGKVEAEDADVGENAAIYYSVPEASPFSIDAIGGEIRTKAKLDFEAQQVHYLVVTASDGDLNSGLKEPRIATATVTVLVQDVADEVPIFPRDVYTVSVPENVEDYLVTTVMAEDKDTETSITYRLLQGDLDKFSVHPRTGIVRTRRGLDFERQTRFSLVIGTEEAFREGLSGAPGASCRVEITVEDRNDIPPLFTRSPRGNVIDVRNDVPIGEVIGQVLASDSDGSAPGNQVSYALDEESSSVRTEMYFLVDDSSGEIIVKDDLSKELLEEYRLGIRAYDHGEPSLDSTIVIVIRVQQVVTVPPGTGVGFATSHLFTQVPENLPDGSVVQVATLVQKPTVDLRIDCNVVSVLDSRGNKVDAKGLFSGRLNGNQDCELVKSGGLLDRETNEEFTVEMVLNTRSAYADRTKLKTVIEILVSDENDNSPVFIYDQESNLLVNDHYLTAIPDNIPVDQIIFRVKANDSDSGDFGRIHFTLLGVGVDYFAIDADSGEVRNTNTFQDVRDADLPFRLIVMAADNFGGASGNSNSQQTDLVINLLRPGHGIVLTVADKTPQEMSAMRTELMEVLQEQSGLVVNIDKMMPAMVLFSNGTCCRMNARGTDVYFHVTDPDSNQILGFQHKKVMSSITGKEASSRLKYTVSGRLGVQASDFHEPYANNPLLPPTQASPIRTETGSSSFGGFPAALIAFGCLVFAIAVAAMAYLCVIKRRLETVDDKQTKMIVIPRYEPVFVEPNLKEYETQVLKMSVPVDEQDNELQVDLRDANHEFNLDSISYITKDRLSSRDSPGSGSEVTRTTSATHLAGADGSNVNGSHYHAVNAEEDFVTPIRNPLFRRSDSEEGLRHLSASQTNANVLFGATSRPAFVSSTPRRASSSPSDDDFDRSPMVDTTTQL